MSGDGQVIRPGDTVLVTVDQDAPSEHVAEIIEQLTEKLPGCTVVVLGGLRSVGVYRPDPPEET